jgi:hypothetical protein
MKLLLAILPGFDFDRVGEVDPNLWGYKLDSIKKELIKVNGEELL